MPILAARRLGCRNSAEYPIGSRGGAATRPRTVRGDVRSRSGAAVAAATPRRGLGSSVDGSRHRRGRLADIPSPGRVLETKSIWRRVAAPRNIHVTQPRRSLLKPTLSVDFPRRTRMRPPDYPRGTRGVAATSPRTIHAAAAAAPRPVHGPSSAARPRRRRGSGSARRRPFSTILAASARGRRPLEGHGRTARPSYISLSMPRGPSVDRTESTTAAHALMLEMSCALPWLVSVPSRKRMMPGCWPKPPAFFVCSAALAGDEPVSAALARDPQRVASSRPRRRGDPRPRRARRARPRTRKRPDFRSARATRGPCHLEGPSWLRRRATRARAVRAAAATAFVDGERCAGCWRRRRRQRERSGVRTLTVDNSTRAC